MRIVRFRMQTTGGGGRGFTVTELLVAMVVMATALLGVYALLSQVVGAEREMSRRWGDRAAAAAVVEHLAVAFEHALSLSKRPAISAESDGSGSGAVELFTQRPVHRHEGVVRAAIARQRYSWNIDEQGAGVVELRSVPYVGTRNLTTAEADEEMEGGIWARVEPVVIGRKLQAMNVAFRVTDHPAGAWEEQGSWKTGDVVVRIRARVGDQTVERIIAPRVNGILGDSDGE